MKKNNETDLYGLQFQTSSASVTYANKGLGYFNIFLLFKEIDIVCGWRGSDRGQHRAMLHGVVGDGARWLTRAIAVGEMHHAWRTNRYTNG